MLNWCEGRVVSKKVWTPGLFTLRIAVEGVQPFEPGQFLHLGQPQPDGKVVSRAYSVASPHGPELEFFIVRVENGELTPILENLEPRDTVLVKEKAAGGFTLSKTPAAESLWLIGTGTGLAPYIAMLRDPLIWEKYQHIVVCHGVRFAADLGYREELCQLAKSRPGKFQYIAAVSREQGEGILHGRLTQLAECGTLESITGQTFCPHRSAIMMCGNPDMLKDMETLLETRGLQRHRSKTPGHIVMETYW